MSTPFAEVYFPATGTTLRPTKLELIREAYSHEIALLRVSDPNVSSIRYGTGSPVRIVWGNFPRETETFYGYVHHGLPEYDEENRHPVADLVCIGMSGPASNPQSRSWLNTRVDLLAAQIATETGMFHETTPSGVVLSGVSQGGVSSWKFLVDKARGAGLVLYPRGPRLYLRDRDTVMRDYGNHARTVRRGPGVTFHATAGELNPTDREAVRREGYGIGQGTPVVAHASDSTRRRDRRNAVRARPLVSKVVTGHGFSSAKEIANAIEAEDREGAYVYEADMDTPVMPKLGVCSPLVIAGFGDRYDGYWSVNRVKFVFDGSDRHCEVKALKSTVTDPLVRPGRAGARARSTYPDRLDDTARLIDGRWVAGQPLSRIRAHRRIA